jgi:cytochrome c55X
MIGRDCGACHGGRLTGGLGPPLGPAELDGKPDELLVETVLFGRPGTPMPGWKGLLTESEARFVVAYLKSGARP